MNGTMEYKGYTGSVEFSKEDSIFFGEVLGIRSLISYEGHDRASLEEDFRGAVDDYLALCATGEQGEEMLACADRSSKRQLAPELATS